MRVNNHVFLLLIAFSGMAFGQAEPPPGEQRDSSGLNPRYASMTKEAAIICGRFLPDQIRGVTENFAMCGARVGLRTAPGSFMDFQFLNGGGYGTRYMLGSVSFRGDVEMYDVIGSMYIGGDLHFANRPVPDAATGSEQTDIFAGGHIGGAVAVDMSDSAYIRTDFQFNLNPGTSLFVGVSLVYRFDPAGEGEANQPK